MDQMCYKYLVSDIFAADPMLIAQAIDDRCNPGKVELSHNLARVSQIKTRQ